ncbi:MAG TPA: hypothetical protein PKM25_08605, partial [Candidatus Ozemobacteraceae bacterium]|nr:hypothetical protein [Candidatus Ozemobacteraceae bacterium]
MTAMDSFEKRLFACSKKHIDTETLESWFPEYPACVQFVSEAIARGILEPVKSSGVNGRLP